MDGLGLGDLLPCLVPFIWPDHGGARGQWYCCILAWAATSQSCWRSTWTFLFTFRRTADDALLSLPLRAFALESSEIRGRLISLTFFGPLIQDFLPAGSNVLLCLIGRFLWSIQACSTSHSQSAPEGPNDDFTLLLWSTQVDGSGGWLQHARTPLTLIQTFLHTCESHWHSGSIVVGVH